MFSKLQDGNIITYTRECHYAFTKLAPSRRFAISPLFLFRRILAAFRMNPHVLCLRRQRAAAVQQTRKDAAALPNAIQS